MSEVKFTHIRMVDGQYVRKRNSTLMQALEELAAHLNGKMIFCCPNYGVVGANGKEITVWMK